MSAPDPEQRPPREAAPGSPAEPPPPPARPQKSFGNMSDAHWSRARKELNQEALDYYRERSRAPGVAEGGAERNFYCMECDGVIPFAEGHARCPHCGASLEGAAKRYFNWVEIDRPPPSDARALAPVFGALALLVAILVLLVVYLLR